MTGSLVGFSLAGRYDVLELVGEGGMGAVYRVFDRELEETVALKVIRQELASARGIVDRFRTEVKLARRVTHVNVARTFELGHAGDLVFCTMELVDGEALRMVLKRRGQLAVEEVAAIACAMCDGLAAAHAAGVIHRDIKPDNVLVGAARVVLTDFGVAALVVDEGEIAGTVAYMAPEQMRGEPPTPAADIYAVGVVIYEMATGSRAFRGSDDAIYAAKQSLARLTVQTEGVPAALADVIARATERDPARRIATAAELAAALAPWRVDTAAAPRTNDARGMETVVVRPPAGGGPSLHIAQAVHAEVLHRLARRPRTRVQVEDTADHALRVELVAGAALDVRVSGPNASALAMQMPLAVEHVRAIAEAVTAAVVASLEPQPRPLEATELLLRADHDAQGDFVRYGGSLERLEHAASLAPSDPRVAAALALALMQKAFFTADAVATTFARARELVRIALDSGPHLFESHLAAGQLELHVADPATAAGHFRVAIACAPHAAMAHEQLGRMLLEAGHLDAGFARLAEAQTLAPHLRSADWQIARACALEGDWDAYDRIIDRMDPVSAVVPRLRILVWRGDSDAARALRAPMVARQTGETRDIFDSLFAVLCDGAWRERRDRLRGYAAQVVVASQRTGAFVGQLVAELAALNGDAEAAFEAIAHATQHGLFDLHWLDRCIVFRDLRGQAEWTRLREPIARRAEAVFDALYGDHPVQAPDRTRVERPVWLDAPTRLG